MKKYLFLLLLPAVLLGCNNSNNETVAQISQNVDQAKEAATQAAAEMKENVEAAAESAKETMQEVTETAQEKMNEAAQTAENTVAAAADKTQETADAVADTIKEEAQAMKGKVAELENKLIGDPDATLTKSHWQLADARNAQGQRIDELLVQPDKPIQFDFNGTNIQISNACNSMGGSYTIQNQQIVPGMLVSTKRLCGDEKINRLDGAVSERLAAPLSFELTSTELKLTTASGDVLTFTAKPTVETRFGSEGEIVFLEIAPETKPCNHPLIPNKQCLQVREVKYDANGTKSYPSENWENFYQDIEGYQHEKGYRNVVRAKRFTIANPPADSPNTAYVLDMVVETALVE